MYAPHTLPNGVSTGHRVPLHRKLLAPLSNSHPNNKDNGLRINQHLRQRLWRLVTFRNVLILFWISGLYWGERKVYRDAVENCQWDTWEDWPSDATPHRMALIADPQLVDPHTYPRRGIALTATMFYTDLYMQKSYSLLNSILLPQTIIFLGDLFDGGREWNPHKSKEGYGDNMEWKGHVEDPRGNSDWKTHGEVYWENEFLRFHRIFPSIPGRRIIRTLPGNHDLGFGNGIDEAVLRRFKIFFGETNSVHSFGNHTFVLIDSVSLSNTENAKIYGPARKFLDDFPDAIPQPIHTPTKLSKVIQNADGPPQPSPTSSSEGGTFSFPRILLTHVPLYRPPDTPCGPQRESHTNSIAIRGGFQYQNVLLAELSADILRKIKPVLVASGDDHDYCEVTHAGATSAGGGTGMVKEITVKAFSWAMGVRKPGFLLVSLWNPVKPGDGNRFADGGPTVQTKLCLLPDQLAIYQFYALMGMLTKFAITARTVWAWWAMRKHKKDDDDTTSGPLLPTAAGKEYAVSSSSYNTSNGMTTRTGPVLGSSYGPKGVCASFNGHSGYGIPLNQYSDPDDKYSKKYPPSPPSTNGLGLGITNLSAFAEAPHLSSLTRHPAVRDGVRLVKGEMLKYKDKGKLVPLLKDASIFALCVGGWYLWLLWARV